MAEKVRAEECQHLKTHEKNDLVGCKECGEVLEDKAPADKFSFRCKFVVDSMSFVYKEKEYISLDYVVKKILQELTSPIRKTPHENPTLLAGG